MPTPRSSGRSLSIMFNWYVLALGSTDRIGSFELSAIRITRGGGDFQVS
jgi:hypothetical protein